MPCATVLSPPSAAAFPFRVPNLSTSLYFIVNDAFYSKTQPKSHLPEGVVVGSLNDFAGKHPELIAGYYARIARTDEDAVTALNKMLAGIKLLFCDHAADDRRFLATQVIEAYVGNNAGLDLYCLEETHAKNVRVSNLYIEQQAGSRVNHNIITLHNAVTRTHRSRHGG